jgi:Restriction endonuclease
VATAPKKPQLLDWLLRQDLVGVHSCDSLLSRAAEACFSIDAYSAAAYTEVTKAEFWNFVVKANERHTARGVSPSFSIQSSETRSFHCYPVLAQLRGKARLNAIQAQNRPAVLRMIYDLTDREYEAMSCVLLEALGATRVNLTRKGTEGGIDAFGLIEHARASHLLGSMHHPIRVVVQSKMWSNPIGPDAMKVFLQTLHEVREGGQPQTNAIVPSWFKEARGAMIGLVVSHKGFQSGADSRARSQGILIADSLDVAEVIALSLNLYGSKGTDKIGACLNRIKELLVSSEPKIDRNSLLPSIATADAAS